MHCLAIMTTAQNLQGRFTLNEYINYLQVPDWVQQTTTRQRGTMRPSTLFEFCVSGCILTTFCLVTG